MPHKAPVELDLMGDWDACGTRCISFCDEIELATSAYVGN